MVLVFCLPYSHVRIKAACAKIKQAELEYIRTAHLAPSLQGKGPFLAKSVPLTDSLSWCINSAASAPAPDAIEDIRKIVPQIKEAIAKDVSRVDFQKLEAEESWFVAVDKRLGEMKKACLAGAGLSVAAIALLIPHPAALIPTAGLFIFTTSYALGTAFGRSVEPISKKMKRILEDMGKRLDDILRNAQSVR